MTRNLKSKNNNETPNNNEVLKNPIFKGSILTADVNAIVYNNRLYLYTTSDKGIPPRINHG